MSGSFPVLVVGCRSLVPWPLPLWLVAAPVFLVPAPVLAFVGKGDVPRTVPVVPLPVRASFRYSLECWQYWSVDFEGVFLRWYISWFTPLPHSFVDFWQSFSTCFQPTGGGRWKNLHVQSGLSVEVYVSFNFSLVSAFCFHCGDPCPTLQVRFLLALFLKFQSPWMCGGNSWYSRWQGCPRCWKESTPYENDVWLLPRQSDEKSDDSAPSYTRCGTHCHRSGQAVSIGLDW